MKRCVATYGLLSGAIVLGMTGCGARDRDAQSLSAEIQALDETVTTTLQTSPNNDGLGKVEALVTPKQEGLNQRVRELQQAKLSPSAASALTQACASNDATAAIALDHVRNAATGKDPALVLRANEFAHSLCNICVTEGFTTRCAKFARVVH